MYRAMVGIGVLCGAAVVSVFEVTQPVIARKQAQALERAVFDVLPETTSTVTFQLGDAGFVPIERPDSRTPVVYAGYDADQRLVGVAIEATGSGYQDRIRLLYGYSLAQEAIIGLRIMESRETPGLGERIETDPAFLENFVRLDASLSPDGTRLAHPIEYVSAGEKTAPWQVDGISGATISSTAVAAILRGSTAVWVPRLAQNASVFTRQR